MCMDHFPIFSVLIMYCKILIKKGGEVLRKETVPRVRRSPFLLVYTMALPPPLGLPLNSILSSAKALVTTEPGKRMFHVLSAIVI